MNTGANDVVTPSSPDARLEANWPKLGRVLALRASGMKAVFSTTAEAEFWLDGEFGIDGEWSATKICAPVAAGALLVAAREIEITSAAF